MLSAYKTDYITRYNMQTIGAAVHWIWFDIENTTTVIAMAGLRSRLSRSVRI